MAKKKDQSAKYILIGVAAFVFIFILFLSVKPFSGPKVYTIDELLDKAAMGEETEDMYLYNAYSFVKADGLWYTRIRDPVTGELFQLPLHYSPRELGDVEIYGDPIAFITQTLLYNTTGADGRMFVTFNPEYRELSYIALANNELLASLIQAMRIQPYPGCDRNTSGCEGGTIVTCDDTDKPVVYLNDTGYYPDDSGDARIIVEGNCMRIEGSRWEIVKAANKALYIWYGIMVP